jgi:trigger factor
MQVKRTNKSDNEVVLLISGDLVELEPIKDHILKDHFAKDIKIPGFREGKAPLNLVEKHVDHSLFQSKFLDEALNNLFSAAINQEKLRSIDQPQVEVKKFVPYTLLEFEATVPVLGKITLPEYKKIRLAKESPKKVTEKDIDSVIDNIKKQVAEKKDVDRAAMESDQVFIDFKGVDDKGKAVSGADGKNYPLALGSNSFIPGFETNLVGLKAGESKTFTLKFPKTYSVKALASRDVTFSVDIIKVQEIIDPEVNADFAAKVGPFKSVEELRKDIQMQLTQERQNEIDREYESKLLKEISSKSKLSLPDILVNDELEKRLRDLKMNLSYRGQTLAEFLVEEGNTEEEYIEKVLKPEAEERLKASIVLSEISEIENIPLTDEEVDFRIQLMKSQYQDPQSQAELSKPDAKRDIASRLLAEKTIQKLTTYSLSK